MHVEIRVTAGPAKGQHFLFTKPKWFLVGRDTDAQISLPDDLYVSRRHFLLKLYPSDCLLRDLNSTNGVLVNGVQYGGKRAQGVGEKQDSQEMAEVCLKNGDEIVLGDTRIKILINPPRKKISPNAMPETPREKTILAEGLSEVIPLRTMCWQNRGVNHSMWP